MNFKVKLAAAAALCAVAVPAQAQEETGGFAAGVTAGTLGIGPEVGFRLSDSFGLRGNATFFGLSRDEETDGVNYNGKLRLRSFGAMIDLHPFGGGFRLSAGARVNRNRVRLAGTPTGTGSVNIGDETFSSTEITGVFGDVEANKLAPTLTLGWGGGASRGVKFGIEAGAMFQGSPEVGNLRVTGTAANNQKLQTALANEEREIEEDINGFKVYPILQLSIGYRF